MQFVPLGIQIPLLTPVRAEDSLVLPISDKVRSSYFDLEAFHTLASITLRHFQSAQCRHAASGWPVLPAVSSWFYSAEGNSSLPFTPDLLGMIPTCHFTFWSLS